MFIYRRVAAFVALTCLCWTTVAEIAVSEDPVTGARLGLLQQAIVGTWSVPVDELSLKLRLDAGGRYTIGNATGNYTIEPTTLVMTSDDGNTVRYQYKLPLANNAATGQLELSGGPLAQALLFSREREVNDYRVRLDEVSAEGVSAATRRVGIVAAIVIFAMIVTRLLKALSNFVIFGEWGPLRYLYRHHKHRSETLHSLALNILKYIVYFSALGLILTEFGVNYTAYLASLSVIGLAIGFGSQGLVQDMVTGFFVIFERQFDVGDMVEISGQTGIVDELGLRMTRIRNYLGQRVVIPNRNIATVGKFASGAQQVTVDVAIVASEEQAAATLIATLGREIAAAYPGVVLGTPYLMDPLILSTGEQFVRLRLAIWPQQTWLVDQQLLPRIREQFGEKGLTLPADRITAYYHAREAE